MTREELNRNAETYKAQVFKNFGSGQDELRFNSEWLEPLKYEDIVRLCAKYTVARILGSGTIFSKRLKENTPISMHELLYILWRRANDSVIAPMRRGTGRHGSEI